MTTPREDPAASDGIARPVSLVDYAVAKIRHRILTGALSPKSQIVEQRLTEELGISRPPLREALRLLEREGLVHQVPRRGTFVVPLMLHDVYEIYTLRRQYESMAVDLAFPIADATRLARCRDAFADMERAAAAGDHDAHNLAAFSFHASIVGLAGHARLESAFRSLQMQMQMCMAMNRAARSDESLVGDVERHRRLLELIEVGDPEPLRAELAGHGDRTFLVGIEDRLDGHTPESLAWLATVRAEQV